MSSRKMPIVKHHQMTDAHHAHGSALTPPPEQILHWSKAEQGRKTILLPPSSGIKKQSFLFCFDSVDASFSLGFCGHWSAISLSWVQENLNKCSVWTDPWRRKKM